MRNVCGIRRVDKVRNAIIRETSVMERIKRNVLKWLGHVERMGDERLVKRVDWAMWRITGREETTEKLEEWSESPDGVRAG